MSDWDKVTLGDVLVQIDERQRDQKISLVLSVTERRGIIPQTEVFTKRIATDDTSKYKVLQPFDIAYNPYLLWTGAVGQWLRSEVGITSPVYETFRVLPGHSPRYWGLVFESGVLTPYFDATAIGSIQRRRRTTVPVFLQAELAAPPLTEQRRIVDVLAVLDAQIKALDAEASAAELVRRRMVGQVAEGAERVLLDRVAVVTQGKGLPKDRQGVVSGEVPWFKIADMMGSGNEFGYTVAATRMSPEVVKSLRGVVVEAGAVVFPRVGAAVLTEKKRILDVDGAVDENHLVLSPRKRGTSEYLLAVMESVSLANHVQTGAVPSLNMGLVRSIEVPWPTKNLEAPEAALGAARQASRARYAELVAIRSLRSILLTSLLNRSISIPESYDALLRSAS